ncbi:hypothetical protein SAMN05216389_11113 [Oceanobacillus limi]|uniref:Uncharacterized protein n=1 Tax=Oceanobacillus limi TaxID=930131 RepID=A0A1I0EBF1_9BACI|nr:hypothetical protein [Oceanobacillus limi]SET42251.1 hypothetical protein SAMN05216389_11113 [Oceanobacillus limi]
MPKKSAKQSESFRWITSEPDRDPFISVDAQRRLYFNAKARSLVGSDTVQIGYDIANKRIIVGAADVVRPANVKPHKIDKRGYASARPLINSVGLSDADLPLRYNYVGRDFSEYPDGAYAFQLMDDARAGEDGSL